MQELCVHEKRDNFLQSAKQCCSIKAILQDSKKDYLLIKALSETTFLAVKASSALLIHKKSWLSHISYILLFFL